MPKAAVMRRFPALALERASAGRAKGVETWDRVLSPLTGVIAPVLILAAAAVEIRCKRVQASPIRP